MTAERCKDLLSALVVCALLAFAGWAAVKDLNDAAQRQLDNQNTERTERP